MADKRPIQRQKVNTGAGLGVTRRSGNTGGSGVGRQPGTMRRPGFGGNGGTGYGSNRRSVSGIRTGVLACLLAILVCGGTMLSRLPAGSTNAALPLAGMLFPSWGWSGEPNTGRLNPDVASYARPRFTALRGGGEDTATVMVYLCGTDLESKNGMATSDLNEMLNAASGDNVNLILFTGGCAQWRNEALSGGTNQIWRIRDGGLEPVRADAGSAPMTDPNTLRDFVSWCAESYPADRYILILWDHGGGSLSGYGYDENHASAGSLKLADIDRALGEAGVRFDFVGFDACLMASAETALMLSRHADYLVASEETEPQVGWYYTGWLTDLAKNPSRPTLELGQRIADDFVEECGRECRGQPATMSVSDLAELGEALGDGLNDFARDTRRLIRSDGYQAVSAARSGAREFTASDDQVDLVHFARNLGTDAGNALADTLLSAVKYNRAANVTNAYGLSIYFPCEELSQVDRALDAYARMGLTGEYPRCVGEFAAMEAAGQAVSGGGASALSTLLGQGPGGLPADADAAALERALEPLLSGGTVGADGTTGAGAADVTSNDGTTRDIAADVTNDFDITNAGTNGETAPSGGGVMETAQFLRDTDLTAGEIAAYLAGNRFDPSYLTWVDGKISMPQEQWQLVRDVELDVVYDDGSGYLDLGLDNACEFDEDGNLLEVFDGSWISINDQPVAYYYLSSSEEGDRYVITGRVPVKLNGERMDLILLFTDETPEGYIAGARPLYPGGETDTVPRGLTPLRPGDTLDFLCDCYGYDGADMGETYLGQPMTVGETVKISNTDIGETVSALCRFTDVYGQRYWTEAMGLK